MEEVKESIYYYLAKKQKPNRTYWYAYFPDPDDPKKVTTKSVESLRKMLRIRDRTPITRKQEAIIITQRAIDAGLIDRDDSDPLFADYVKEFWDFDNSKYIRRRNKKNPNSIGKDYALNLRGTFITNGEPHIPNNLRLSQVTTAIIEDVINDLIDEGRLSMATIKRVVQSMSVPLKEAARLHRILTNPMLAVDSISSKPKERGILTESEMVALLSYMRSESEAGRFDRQVYLASILSAYTGMRQGEVMGLKAESITLVNNQHGIILINDAFAKYAGFKTPKGKRDRKVPAPRWLCDQLLEMARLNTNNNGLIFWSKRSKTNPISASYIRDTLYAAIADLFEKGEGTQGETVSDGNKKDKNDEQIMIRAGEATRRNRNISFHSFRHYFVTQMRGKLTENDLRSVVGHQSEAMTDNYTHDTTAGLLRIGEVTSNILPFPNPAKAIGE
jgi:integrase